MRFSILVLDPLTFYHPNESLDHISYTTPRTAPLLSFTYRYLASYLALCFIHLSSLLACSSNTFTLLASLLSSLVHIWLHTFGIILLVVVSQISYTFFLSADYGVHESLLFPRRYFCYSLLPALGVTYLGIHQISSSIFLVHYDGYHMQLSVLWLFQTITCVSYMKHSVSLLYVWYTDPFSLSLCFFLLAHFHWAC